MIRTVTPVEGHKHVIGRLFDEVWNGRDQTVIPELYTEDLVVDYRPYAPLRHGHEAIRAMLEGAIQAFPDYHEELLDACVEGDRAAVHLRITGTHLGRWGPLAPTGRRLVFEEMVWLSFAPDGRVAHQRGITDNLHALRQAGLRMTVDEAHTRAAGGAERRSSPANRARAGT